MGARTKTLMACMGWLATVAGGPLARGQDALLARLHAQRDAILADIADVTARMAELSDEISVLQDMIAELEDKLAQATNDTEYAAVQAQIRMAYNRLSAVSAAYDELVQELISLLDELSDINQQIEENTNE